MPIVGVLPCLAAADFDTMVEWYERLMGRPADSFPMEGMAEWRLAEAGSVQLVHDPGHTGGGRLTLLVDDVDEHVAGLAERGLRTGPVDEVAEKARTASITDPEGNTVTIAQSVSAD